LIIDVIQENKLVPPPLQIMTVPSEFGAGDTNVK